MMKMDESVIDTLPENQQVSAKKIVRVLCSYGGDLVSWSADTDVSIIGEPLPRANFTDLLSGVVRSRPSKNIPPLYEKFLLKLVCLAGVCYESSTMLSYYWKNNTRFRLEQLVPSQSEQDQ